MTSGTRRSGHRTATHRVVVYSAQFGDYDPIMPVLRPDPGSDYVILSDRRMRVPSPWTLELVTVPEAGLNDRMRNRWCKLHATEIFGDHDLSVYVDAHLQIVGDLRPLVEQFVLSRAPIGLIPQWRASSVDEEVELCKRAGRISPRDHTLFWPEQRARQRAAGFKDDFGVFVGGVVFRDHRHQETSAVEALWWNELRGGVPRDQVALPFALWATGTEPYRLPLTWPLRSPLRYWDHLPRAHRYHRVVRWFAARQALRPWYRWPIRLLTPRAALRAVAARRRRDPDMVPGQ